MGLVDVIMKTIESSPEVQEKINSNATTKQYWQTIKSGDQNAGIALANEILKRQGIDRDAAIKQAQEGLQNMFGGR